MPNAEGYFGPYGGQLVPPHLKQTMDDINVAYEEIRQRADFQEELASLFADYVGRPAPPGRVEMPARLPTDAELSTPGPARSQAYDRAWSFATFVGQTYGPHRLRELYVAACAPGHPDAATAVRTVLGIDLPA